MATLGTDLPCEPDGALGAFPGGAADRPTDRLAGVGVKGRSRRGVGSRRRAVRRAVRRTRARALAPWGVAPLARVRTTGASMSGGAIATTGLPAHTRPW